jgi:transposase
MITIEFSDEAIADLAYQRYHYPHPFVQRKMQSLWLKSQGRSHKDICQITSVCYTTLEKYLRQYESGGIEALKVLPFYRPKSGLDEHQATLEAYFRENPPANATVAMGEIERLTGVKRSPERVRQFMKRMGMKCRKVGAVPAKADIELQAEFKKKISNPGWKRQKPEIGPYFS